jgi:hypothetical protein
MYPHNSINFARTCTALVPMPLIYLSIPNLFESHLYSTLFRDNLYNSEFWYLWRHCKQLAALAILRLFILDIPFRKIKVMDGVVY